MPLIKPESSIQNRRGDWIQTSSGIQFWPLDPCVQEVNVEDIAHSLALLCRFNGHCRRFYSVAEHCVHVASLLPPSLQRIALLHDASEAYIADIPMPIKGSLIGYKEIEHRLMQVIGERFGFLWPMPKEVKEADSILLATEKLALMGAQPAPWHPLPPPLDKKIIKGWPPKKAEKKFLDTFYKLGTTTLKCGR
ncbi:MAG: phosphohydrolase [Magnetococcus sp. DMHC-6]